MADARPDRDNDREERIQMETVVDAYDGYEQAAFASEIREAYSGLPAFLDEMKRAGLLPGAAEE